MKVSKKHTRIKHRLTIKGCSEKVLDSISQQQIRELHEQGLPIKRIAATLRYSDIRELSLPHTTGATLPIERFIEEEKSELRPFEIRVYMIYLK